MTFTYRHRKEILIGVLIFLLLSVIGGAFILKSFKPKEEKNEKIVLTSKKEEPKEEIKEEDIYYQVDIKGEVNNPGIYTVKEGSRVIDVIRLAGDITESADTSVLNLSKKVFDEMVIIVYSYDEVINFTATKEKEKQEQEACIKQSELINGACIESEENSSSLITTDKVSINQATIEELMTLPGIGEAKAQAIINYREEVGSFQTIEELLEVEGIGESIFAQIKENITI